MNIDIQSRPAGASARIGLDMGEKVVCEVGAMIAMSTGMRVETTSRSTQGGGVLKGLRRMFSGESYFLNHFTATAAGQELWLGPALVGDIVKHTLSGTLVAQGGSWLASSGQIDIDTTWQGLTNALLSGEGIFWVKCSGQGDVLLNSFGAIYEITLKPGEEYTVDSGHIVAFEDTLRFTMIKAGDSLLGSFLGGEGLACRFSGQGKLYCQTHNPPSFGRALGPLLRARKE